LAALTACLATILFARAGSTQAPLRHDVTVTLKLIQVYVTGPDGKPALGLERDDFALTDNGRPRTITEFERHVLAVPAAERPVAAALPAPVPVPGGAAAAGGPLLNRKFVFLIDYVRNVFEGVQKAKAAALDFLETKIAPDDEVALYTLSPMSSLTLYEHFTTDHDKVRAKIRRLREFVAGGASFASDELTGMGLMNAQVFAGHGGHAGPSQRNIFEDIADWAKALRAIPGQKNVILFTMGFGNGAVRPGRLNNVLFEAMARALASANAPVFTVDTTPQNVPGRDIEDKLPSGTLAERSLDYLSKTTGGMYLGGVNNSARIADALQDATANYYVLGYSVPAAWDGKYHEVEVEVRKPGYAVHAQGGYFNPVPFAKLSPIEKHIHLLEIALAAGSAGPKATAFPLIAQAFGHDDQPNTLLLAEISAEVRESVGDRVELIHLILGPDSTIVDGKRVELGQADLGAAGAYEYSTAALRPGRYECRAVLRNLDDGRAAAGACVADVAAQPAGAAMAFPPLFLVRGHEARYLNLAAAGPPDGRTGSTLSAIFPFPAKDYVPLVGPLERGETALFASLRCSWGDRRAEAGRELAARIAPEGSEAWEPVEMSLLASVSQAAADVYLLEFELPELAPGHYRLEITATDEAGAAVARTAGALTVKGDKDGSLAFEPDRPDLVRGQRDR
jgi:VWFA-related protein